MKKLLLLALGAVVLAGCGFGEVISNMQGPTIQGSGKMSSLTREVGSFKGVQLDGSMNAEITVGKHTSIKIEGDDNLLGKVKTEVKNGTLRIYFDGNYSTNHELKVSMGVAELDTASVNGSGDLVVRGCSGGKLSLSINGSGDVKANGKVDRLSSSISGSGDMDLFDLASTDADISIRGSGTANVTVSGNLTASIAGSGDVNYKGHPKQITPSVAGSGSVKEAGNG